MYQTSNGILTTTPTTLRGRPVLLTGVRALDALAYGYTHLVIYWGVSETDGVAGSTLIDARTAVALIEAGVPWEPSSTIS